jgi:FtsP/CotA-like multicopper oxidase with cupredoxin domain
MKLNRRRFIKAVVLGTPLVGAGCTMNAQPAVQSNSIPSAPTAVAAAPTALPTAAAPTTPPTAVAAAPTASPIGVAATEIAVATPAPAAAPTNLSAQLLAVLDRDTLPAITIPVASSKPAVNLLDFQPKRLESQDGVLDYDLTAEFINYKIYEGRRLTVRAYNRAIPPETMVIRPGDLVRVRHANKLPLLDEGPHSEGNHPHGFNRMNLHVHGLHVSPEGDQDNVLVDVGPDETFLHTYRIPAGHNSSLSWYHPHKHGSAALQMSGGMLGNLIVQGGPDDLRAVPEIAAAREVELIFNQVIIEPDTNMVPEFIDEAIKQKKVAQTYTINGVPCRAFTRAEQPLPLPEIHMRPGEVQHWRLTQGAILRTLPFELVEGADNGAHDAVTQAFHIVAYDGWTRAAPEAVHEVMFAPGNRLDILVQLDKPGTYTFRGQEYNDFPGGFPFPEEPLPLFNVVVAGEPATMALPSRLTPAADADIADDEIARKRKIAFSVKGELDLLQDIDKREFFVNDVKFDGNVINETMLLGTAEEWEISSDAIQDHPFHIHVNPFQVLSIDGTPITPPRWMDTINVQAGKRVVIRHRFTVYSGRTVFHCHLIPHEDHGMMALIDILDPQPATIALTAAGGSLVSNDPDRRVVVHVPAQAADADAIVSYQFRAPPDPELAEIFNAAPALPAGLAGVERFFTLGATQQDTALPQLRQAAVIEVRYLNPDKPAITNTAQLYRWDTETTTWTIDGINRLSRSATSVVATTPMLGTFAVLYDPAGGDEHAH